MSLLKPLMIAAAVIALPSMASAAVIYDLTLTDASNPAYSGTGVLKLNAAPAASSGLTNYAISQVSSLTFTVDGHSFAYPGGGSQLSAVEFLNGALYDITFAQQVGAYTLDTTGGYAFYYPDQTGRTVLASGTMTAALAAVPEPATWAMMIVGLGATGAMLRRRKASRQGGKSIAGAA